jgi:hypothetical protein
VPKKTKKEKIIAELRHKLETVKVDRNTVDLINEVPQKRDSVSYPNENTGYKLPLSNYQVSSPHLKSLSTTVSIEKNSYIINDLRKTLMLTFLAISFEIFIYWFTELGGNRFLKFLPMFK